MVKTKPYASFVKPLSSYAELEVRIDTPRRMGTVYACGVGTVRAEACSSENQTVDLLLQK